MSAKMIELYYFNYNINVTILTITLSKKLFCGQICCVPKFKNYINKSKHKMDSKRRNTDV